MADPSHGPDDALTERVKDWLQEFDGPESSFVLCHAARDLIRDLLARVQVLEADLRKQNIQLHEEIDARLEYQVENENLQHAADAGWYGRAMRAEARVQELEAALAITNQIGDSFRRALKPLNLSAIIVDDPGQHVTFLRLEKEAAEARVQDLEREVTRLQGYVQHKPECPIHWPVYWSMRAHHIDHHDVPAIEKCNDPCCVAWVAAWNEGGEKGEPVCTCGLAREGAERNG